jgi:hypothetical protein
MTIRPMVVVGLADVDSIRVECARCHAALSVRLDQTVRLPYGCPNCQEPWGDRINPAADEFRAVAESVVDALKTLSGMGRRESPHFTVSLEVPEWRAQRVQTSALPVRKEP